MIKINLNPEKKTKKKKKVAFKIPAWLLVVLILLPITGEIGYSFYIKKDIQNLNGKKQKLQTQVNRLKLIKRKIIYARNQVNKLKNLKNELIIKEQIIAKLDKVKKLPVKKLQIIKATLPDGVWLTKTSINGDSFSFNGFSFNPKLLSLYVRNLKEHFEKIDFTSVKRKENSINAYYSFSIKSYKLQLKGDSVESR